MRTRYLGVALGAVLVATLLLPFPAGAGPSGGIRVRGVIVAADTTTGEAVVFNALDGSGRAVLPNGGDVTHSGLWEQLYLKTTSDGHRELFAAGLDQSDGEQLTDDPALTIGPFRWSVSGARIAWLATRPDETDWLYVADVIRSDGRAVELGAVTAVVQLPSALTISWANDDRRIAVTMPVPVPGLGTTQEDVFVVDVDVDAGTYANITNSPSVNEYHPAFSPVADRVAFVRRTSKAGAYRNDVFVLDLRTGRVTQVTSKSNANLAQIMHPTWSPDGGAFAFAAWPLSGYPSGIYRIAADGSTKAVYLTGMDHDSYLNPQWRRGPTER